MNWYEDPIYIKMCEKATEIQSYDNGEHGSYHVFLEPWRCECGKFVGERFKGIICDKCGKEVGFPIWLPTQSQLQKMVLPDPDRKDAWGEPMPPDPKNDSVFWMFHYFAEAIQERKWSQQTAEQLWLRYVYHKKYGKLWDSEKEEWVE